jgi:Transposase DDE domain group 1
VLVDPAAVHVTRYRYRGDRIPSPWTRAERAQPTVAWPSGMDSWRAGCAATRTSGSEARAGETGRSRGRYRAPARPYDALRCGSTAMVLGHRVMAPSTLGTFLRAFTFGHVRQLDRLCEQTLQRAWAAGAGPGGAAMTIDLDSTVCEVHGHHKQGAAYGYTPTLGYHPLLASRADTGEVLHARQRTGRANTARGTTRFVDEVAGRVRRAGATGQLTMRMDSGFWSARTIRACQRHQIHYSSPSARPRRSRPRSPPSKRTPGPRSSTPTAASPKSPRPATRVTG